MKNYQLLLFFACALIAFQSCNTQDSENKEPNAAAMAESSAQRSNAMFINHNYSDWNEKIGAARINFGDFTVAISGIDMWTDGSAPINTNGDIINLDIAPGNNLEEQVISISGGVLENVLIEQRFETSMLVYGNDKMCELLDWKHFTSDWTALNKTPKGEYKCQSYNLKERTQFPAFSQEELKEEVKNKCSETCYESIKDVAVIDEDNSSIAISHYYIKVSGSLKSTGEKIEKTIKIYNPVGC